MDDGIGREEVLVHLTPTRDGWVVHWPVQAACSALVAPGWADIVRGTIVTSSALVAAATALQALVQYLGWSRDLVSLKRLSPASGAP